MADVVIGAIVSAIQYGIDIIKQGFTGLFTFFGIGVGLIFGWANFQAKEILGYVGKEEFEFQPEPPNDPSIFAEIVEITQMIISEILVGIGSFLAVAGVVLTLVGPTLLLTAGLFIFLYFWSNFYGFLALSFSNVVISWAVYILQLWTPILNILLDVMAILAPGMNILFKFLIMLVEIIFHVVCPVAKLTGNIINDCPIIDTIFQLVITYYKLYWSILSAAWTILGSIVSGIGGLICPGGICDVNFCSKYGTETTCPFTANIFVDWLGKTSTSAFEVLIPAFQLGFSFVMDIFKFFAFGIFFLTKPANTDGGPLAFISSPGNALPGVKLDPTGKYYNTFKDIQKTGVDLENVVIITLDAIAKGILAFTILIDNAICNTLNDIWNCVAVKICYFFAYPQDVWVPVPIYILPPYPYIVWIKTTFDIGSVCRGVGLYPNRCGCDQHIFTDPVFSILVPNLSTSRSGCIQVSEKFAKRLCEVVFRNGAWVYGPYYNGSPCLCNNIPNPDTPWIYIFDGIWVTCVPGQAPCSRRYSLLPGLVAA